MADSSKYIKPGAGQRKMNNFLAKVGAPAVAIPGRKSGALRVAAIIPVTVDGKRYLVSTRGNSDWALNLRVAGRGELRRGWSRKQFTGIEVAGAERERVVTAYRQRYGIEVNQYFERLPDFADHPTFRLEFS